MTSCLRFSNRGRLTYFLIGAMTALSEQIIAVFITNGRMPRAPGSLVESIR
ncbi:MAG: hypothetical protein AVDCRST_MAG87-3073 [uncultured Thermomicrobiales bacterium]|uniref:Uncharacterized protein n=1 Tax=uncultured Thermomicrobiales bacterium TaxID=1645740 RepID=A0A6J4VGH2_9BACT|nr:MAG: hypothetical protein AVDCRST_MAG87-3073 [uncultured Thermomicrobiales bacterium]